MAKARGKAFARRTETIDRLHQNEWGVWHWKVEKKLREHFKGRSLGRDQAAAEREARRLNADVETWLKAKAQGVAPPPRLRRRAGPLTVSQGVNLWTLGEDGLGSDSWRGMRDSTRRVWRHHLRRFERAFGDDAASSFTRTRALDWLEPIKRRTPGTARGLASCLRTFFQWLIDKSLIALEANPFARPRVGSSGKRDRLWTLDDVRHFVAVCDGRVSPPPKPGGYVFRPRPSLGTMLVLGFGLVQREWDVLELGREHLREEIVDGKPTGATRIRFRQSKSMKVGKDYELEGGKLIDARLPPIVAARLTAAPPPDTERARGRLCVNEYTGRPYEFASLSATVRPMIERAIACDPKRWGHLKGLTMRDGRRSGFVHLRRHHKLTVEQIVNLSGHSLEEGYEIVEHYLPRTAEEADEVAALMTGEL